MVADLSEKLDKLDCNSDAPDCKAAYSPSLPEKWSKVYQDATLDFDATQSTFKMAFISATKGTGKTTLVKALTDNFGAKGTNGTVSIEGQKWLLLDKPSVQSEFGSIKETKLKKYVKEHHLTDCDEVDAVALVVSDLQSEKAYLQEREFLNFKKLRRALPPLLVIVTHASASADSSDTETNQILLESLGLEHQPNVEVLYVDLAAKDSSVTQTLDFPKMLNTLSSMKLTSNLLSQAAYMQIVRQEVNRIVLGRAKPKFCEKAWVLVSHSVLAFTVPFVGPVTETVIRMCIVACSIYESAGLLKMGSTKEATEKLSKVKDKDSKSKKVAKGVASSTGETGGVAIVEGMSVNLVQEMGTALWEVTADLAWSVASEQVVGFLPIVGAAISMCTMGHAYKSMAKGAIKIACTKHAAWLTNHADVYGLCV